jgi:peptidoglycan/xylan/chitin deacetylase (PgdA/CDA1 family)
MGVVKHKFNGLRRLIFEVIGLTTLMAVVFIVVLAAGFVAIFTPAMEPTFTPHPSDGATETLKQVEQLEPDTNLAQIEGGTLPIYLRVPTKEPVVFLTIDDGAIISEEMLGYMKAHQVKATLFLNDQYVLQHAEYFKRFLAETGSVAELHTVTHPLLTRLGRAAQSQEICQNRQTLIQTFGTNPALLRPPYGEYDEKTKVAATLCGVKAMFLWSAQIENGNISYRIGHNMEPGDIVLMHFRETGLADVKAFVEAAKARNLHFDTLDRWVRY